MGGNETPRGFRSGPAFVGPLFFLIACGIYLDLGRVFSWAAPALGLDALKTAGLDALRTPPPAQLDLTANCWIGQGIAALHLYAAQSRWSATFVFLLLACAASVAAAVVTVVSIWKDEDPTSGPRPLAARRAIVTIGLVLLVVAGFRLATSSIPSLAKDQPITLSWPGPLQYLLTTFRKSEACEDIVAHIWWSRRIAETAGLIVAAAIAATAAPLSNLGVLVRRIAAIKNLLYFGSLLFVVGMLISQANFTWIAATWTSTLTSEKATKEITDVISAGTMQAGVGYSAMLAVFYLPARAYLEWQVRQNPVPEPTTSPPATEQKDEKAGAGGSLTEEVRQVLALLAPILSAPVLDALLKK